MPRLPVVVLLLAASAVCGCQGPGPGVRRDPPDAFAAACQAPPPERTPVLDWIKEHPVATAAATVLVVAAGVVVGESFLVLRAIGNTH
jgi:hypothetical protein